MCDFINMVGVFFFVLNIFCYKILMIFCRLNGLIVLCIIGVFNFNVNSYMVVNWRGEWWFVFDFDRIFVFEDDIGMFDFLILVIELIGYVDRLVSVGLALENDYNIFFYFIFSFYELVNVIYVYVLFFYYLYYVKIYFFMVFIMLR